MHALMWVFFVIHLLDIVTLSTKKDKKGSLH